MVRWNVDLTLRWMINGAPPDEYTLSDLLELMRARAIAGQPIDDSVLVYRRGARMFWEALLDLADGDDRSLLIARSDTVWGYLEDYVDMVVGCSRGRTRTSRTRRPRPATYAPARCSIGCARGCRSRSRTATAPPGSGSIWPRPSARSPRNSPGPRSPRTPTSGRDCARGALAFTEGVRVSGLTSPGFGWATFLADPRLLLAQDPPVASRPPRGGGRESAGADRHRGPVWVPGTCVSR